MTSPPDLSRSPRTAAEATIPALSWSDLEEALDLVASTPVHRIMIPYLVSGLQRQAPFLTPRLILFEILRAGNCLADEPQAKGTGPPPTP